MAPTDKFRSLAVSRSNRQKKQTTSVKKLLGVEHKSEGTTSTAAMTYKTNDDVRQHPDRGQQSRTQHTEMFSNDNFFQGNDDSWVVNPKVESKKYESDKSSSDENEWNAFENNWDKSNVKHSSGVEVNGSEKYDAMDRLAQDYRSKSVPRDMKNYSVEKIQHLALSSRRAKEEHGKSRSSREYNELIRGRKYAPEKLSEHDKVKMVDAMLALSKVTDRQERKMKAYRKKITAYKEHLDEKDDIIKELIEEREELRNIVIETRVQCKIYRNRAEDMHREMMGIQQSMASLQVERDDFAARYSILASKLERDPTLDDDILTNNDTLTNEPSTKFGASSIGSSTFDVEKEALAHQVQALKEQLNDKVDQQVMLEYELAKQKEALLAREQDEDARLEMEMAPHNVTFKKARGHLDVDSDVSED